jgi:hypothetical protein
MFTLFIPGLSSAIVASTASVLLSYIVYHSLVRIQVIQN